MCLPVTSCCFCLSLDVGTKVVSILSVVSSALTAIIYGAAAILPSPESRRLVYAVVTAGATVQLVVGCTLIYGVFQKSQRLLIPWLVTAWVYCVSLLALSVFGAGLVVLNYARDSDTAAEISTMVSVYFLHGLVLYYCASVISSRREEMLREDSTESAQRLMRDRRALERFAV